MPAEKRDVLEMLAEFLRETAVLILVFVPLELYTKMSKLSIAIVFSSATLLLLLGIVLERKR